MAPASMMRKPRNGISAPTIPASGHGQTDHCQQQPHDHRDDQIAAHAIGIKATDKTRKNHAKQHIGDNQRPSQLYQRGLEIGVLCEKTVPGGLWLQQAALDQLQGFGEIKHDEPQLCDW